jgi:hypothetical protein
MYHMIADNLEAYRRAVAETATAQATSRLNPTSANIDNLTSCQEEERVRCDGLMYVIRLAIQEAAAHPPHNPFSINGDVNQPDVQPRSRLQQAMDDDPQIRNEHGSYPPPPKRD